jgi:hypothetical protein
MRKRPLTDAPERLSDEERARLRKWLQAKYPRLYPQGGYLWEQCRDWHLSRGQQRSSWEATYRMWVRQHIKFEQRRERGQHPRPGDYELPQDQGERGEGETEGNDNLIKLGDYLRKQNAD